MILANEIYFFLEITVNINSINLVMIEKSCLRTNFVECS